MFFNVARHQALMIQAFQVAEGSDHNATKIGCVLAAKQQRIGEASNRLIAPFTYQRLLSAELKYLEAHAECRAVLAAMRAGQATLGATAYVTHRCCPGCLHVLQKAGVRHIIYPAATELDRQSDGVTSPKARDGNSIHLKGAAPEDWQAAGHLKDAAVQRLFGLHIIYLPAPLPRAEKASPERSRGERKAAQKQAPDKPSEPASPYPHISLNYAPENPSAYSHPDLAALWQRARAGNWQAPAEFNLTAPPDCRMAGILIELGVRALRLPAAQMPGAPEFQLARQMLAERGVVLRGAEDPL